VTEQELDLIQFVAREVAETGAGAPQVVRRQLIDAGVSRSGAHQRASIALRDDEQIEVSDQTQMSRRGETSED
jgi:hypothetical protein